MSSACCAPGGHGSAPAPVALPLQVRAAEPPAAEPRVVDPREAARGMVRFPAGAF